MLPNSKKSCPTGYEQLQRAFVHAAAGCAVTDTNGKCVAINEAFARILAYEASPVEEANIFELTHPEDQPRDRSLLNQLLAGEIPDFIIEKRYVRGDGTSIWVRNSVTVFKKTGSSQPNVIHICEDISERKRLEKVVEAQDKLALLGRLTSSIMHEITNPLESMRYLVYLASQSSASQEVKAYLISVEEEISRIAHIAAQTLEFHRRPNKATQVAVVALLQSVMTLFRARIQGSNIVVHIDKTEHVMLTCFPSEIRQVVANLLSNAIDAMSDGGTLRLKVRRATDWRNQSPGIRISVADTGVGMSGGTRKHIYDSFFTTKGVKGTGMGLWVSAAIIDRHQGSIHVRSKLGPSGGTVFTIILPEHRPDESPPDKLKIVA